MTSRPAFLALCLLAFASIAAGAEDKAAPPRMVVVGRAVIETPPDHAIVSVGIDNRGATAAAAIDENSVAAAKIAEAARGFGIAPGDIRTGYVSLQPAFRNVRDASGQFEQKPDGYRATNSLQIRVRDLPKLGEFLRRFVDGGANRISGIAFGVTDRAKVQREAGAAAVADAQGQAAALATAAGIRLGRVDGVRFAPSGGGPIRPMRLGELRAAAPDVPIEPGSLEISAEVEVSWTIEGP